MAKVTLGTSCPTKDGQAVHCSCEFEVAEFNMALPKASHMRTLLRGVLGVVCDGNRDPVDRVAQVREDVEAFFAGPAANGTLGEDAENMVHNVISVANKHNEGISKPKLLQPSAAAIAAVTKGKR